jgi:hypothetical protein
VIVTALSVNLIASAPPGVAQYFSSLSGLTGAPPEAQRASSAALAGLGGVLLALSKLEANKADEAKSQFDAAAGALSDSIASFKGLAQARIAAVKLDPKKLHPEERSFLNDPGLLGLGTGRLDTAGDVFALTAGALSVTLSNVNTFRQSRSPQAYGKVRDDISLLLRIGQATSELLSSAH